ncbi:substrate-binding domain-containing protein, partial [Klebsiella variicola]
SAQIREILISESAWEEMTCLFAPSLVYNDIAANYIIDGLKEKGISIPEDVAIASFDNTLLAQTKKITSVAQPVNEIAHLAFQMVKHQQQPDSIEMHEIVSRLIVRESSVKINITSL